MLNLSIKSLRNNNTAAFRIWCAQHKQTVFGTTREKQKYFTSINFSRIVPTNTLKHFSCAPHDILLDFDWNGRCMLSTLS